MPLTVKQATASQGFQAEGTYTASDFATFVYKRPFSNTAGTTIDLSMHYKRPIGVPAGTLVPLVYALSPGGYGLVNPELTVDAFGIFVTAGAVVVSPDYRVYLMYDVSDSDHVAGDSNVTKSVRVGMKDVMDGFDFLMKSANQNFGGVQIDPRRVFIVGDSAGGQLAGWLATQRRTKVVAWLASRSGYGVNTSTADLRAFMTENMLIPGSPPAFISAQDADPVIDGTPNWNIVLGQKVDDDPGSFVAVGAGAAHDATTPVTYEGESLNWLEAGRRFFNSKMVGLSSRPTSRVGF